jgi:plastocyanin
MKKAAIIAGLAIVVIAIGIFIFNIDSAEAPQPGSALTEETAGPEQASQPEQSQEDAQFNMVYSDSGFEPSSLTVPAGTVVSIQNNSSSALQFSSDPHPAHTDNPELNAITLEPGSQATVEVTTKGAWGVHNHLNHSHTATLTVE